MDHEREVGQILEGIKNLNKRYDSQEIRLGNLEGSVHSLCTSVALQPVKCLKEMESRFVTRDQLVPVENAYRLIKRASIYLFCSFVAGMAIAIEYIRRLS